MSYSKVLRGREETKCHVKEIHREGNWSGNEKMIEVVLFSDMGSWKGEVVVWNE